MKPTPATLALVLQFSAAAQLGVAILNLFLVRLLNWQDDVKRMPLLLREVFYVHAWFISITLTIFALLTLWFSNEMSRGNNVACMWLAGCIGTFWAIRTVLQVTHYSSSHWRGDLRRTCIHVTLLLMYGGFTFAYLAAAFGVIE
jgi:hypothetical protein